MPFTSQNLSFFKHIDPLYKATKTSHDLRLGHTLLAKSVKDIYQEMPSWKSATHLSYILPGISFFCSTLNKDIEIDWGACLWNVVNGLQCYIPLFSNSKILTLGAYSLDVGLGYVKDKKYSAQNNDKDVSIINYLKNSSETVYALLILGNVSANVFNQNNIGFIFFVTSLFLKILLLTRDQQLSRNVFFCALLQTLAPIALLFSVHSDFNLIFDLAILTLALYLMGSSSLQQENSFQIQEEQFLKTETDMPTENVKGDIDIYSNHEARIFMLP